MDFMTDYGSARMERLEAQVESMKQSIRILIYQVETFYPIETKTIEPTVNGNDAMLLEV